jgi:hypothetical protein
METKIRFRQFIDVKLQDLSRFRIIPHYEGLKENYIYPPLFNEWQLNEAPYHITWSKSDVGIIGYFKSPEFDYEINFEPFHYPFNSVNYECVNVNFKVLKDGEYTTDLTPTNHANQVIGTIQNSLTEKLIQYDIDAIIFAATDNIQSRMKLYGRMTDKFSKQFGKVYKGIKFSGGEAIVILANHIPEQNQEALINFAKKSASLK